MSNFYKYQLKEEQLIFMEEEGKLQLVAQWYMGNLNKYSVKDIEEFIKENEDEANEIAERDGLKDITEVTFYDMVSNWKGILIHCKEAKIGDYFLLPVPENNLDIFERFLKEDLDQIEFIEQWQMGHPIAVFPDGTEAIGQW